jgi:hypothetical protein
MSVATAMMPVTVKPAGTTNASTMLPVTRSAASKRNAPAEDFLSAGKALKTSLRLDEVSTSGHQALL